MLPNTSQLEKTINIVFHDTMLLEQSLTHRSYLREHPESDKPDNERLEFLGDAVLQLIVSEYLYHHYPEKEEGELTQIRSALVRTENLAKAAKSIDLESYLLVSSSEVFATRKARQSITANAFEALIGTLYLDQGRDSAKEFISELIIIHLPDILERELHLDPKNTFQAITQEKYKLTPEYRLLSSSGPSHSREFIIGVYLGNTYITRGKGSSKQEATMRAAEEGLKTYEMRYTG